jgi:hypothetical protein
MTPYVCTAIPGNPLWFPARGNDASLDYSLNIASALDAGTDFPASATFAIAPSGAGEAVASSLTYSGGGGIPVFTVTLSGGVQGRIYTWQLVVTCFNGLIYEFIGYQGVIPGLPGYPVPVAPSPGFGTPITWTAGTTMQEVVTGLIGTGTNQATATLLYGFTSIISSAPSGTGFILPGYIQEGTIIVQDMDLTHNATIYPPVGAHINNLAVNVPFTVGSNGGRISFSTNAPATQWYAG